MSRTPCTRWGFAWAHGLSAASYTPISGYAYNSSGQPIKITRSGPGRYAVRFAGLGGNGKSGGHVQVTAYGYGTTDSKRAKVAYWSSSGADFIAHVRCHDSMGKHLRSLGDVSTEKRQRNSLSVIAVHQHRSMCSFHYDRYLIVGTHVY